MPYYDDDTKAAFLLRYGRPLPLFENNTDDPNTDIEAADFLRDRIWQYCADVIAYVRQYHPTAVFECLWPLDANQGQPAPDPLYRRLNMHVNLPLQWKTSAYGIQYFRSEGYDYDVVQKRIDLTEDTIDFPHSVCGRPGEECMFLHGIFTPDPIQDEVYPVWKSKGFYSLALWAFDQFCLYSLPLPLGNVTKDFPARKTSWYRRPGGARPNPVIRQSTPLPAPPPDGKLNSAPLNQP
jgi:hypothetical protein